MKAISTKTLLETVSMPAGSAWFASVAFHSVVLIILGCIYWTIQSPGGSSLIATNADANDSQDISLSKLEKMDTAEQGGSPSTSQSPVNQVITTHSQEVTVPTVEFKNAQIPAMVTEPIFSAQELNKKVKTNINGLSGLRHLSGLHQGNGNGGSGNGKGSGSFLGTSPDYRKIVYVVDSSGSMNTNHDSPALTRMGRVKVEMLRSIEALKPDQEFYIVFFSSIAAPMKTENKSFIRRDSEELEKHLVWVAKHYADGDTDPREALQIAFNLKPDIIFFLTDGQINPLIARDIVSFNQNKVKINTICISSAPSETLMKEIARVHNGKYTFVP